MNELEAGKSRTAATAEWWRRQALEAQKRVVEMEAERRWIPVGERLPEHSGWYVVVGKLPDWIPMVVYYDAGRDPAWGDMDDDPVEVLYWLAVPKHPDLWMRPDLEAQP